MALRLLIQQCISARLKLPSYQELEIGRGVIVFICFFKDANEEAVKKAYKLVSQIKLSEKEEGDKRGSVVETAGEIMIIPQATLGGKLKGSSVQYHNNIPPEQGRVLYDIFCNELETLEGVTVRRGEYGARQVLSMETNGPYSHCFDI
ncbi:putative D-tyrosyl-tRNA(Tyr) deacylase 2 [Eurytemora carolleeae]|uniref:putative D-tyrosyl-tRNA(Tyr) deacylase 2 n=1 Tax=Eurytemora carolleeae TaxID=1294199 RepID=UPI000C7946C8|nr:putative D-tyrosyl-tRNA(Tyr) deacylase 2 [Eurytemora carolleeae]|eukprot:XP_023336604.1 putative D-tyrosyl-tRNA(Tyr) deacylase 2 [Eurytemora affinis]